MLFEEALEIVLNSAQTMAIEQVDINGSMGRVLAEDVVSDLNMPPFDRSAVDGFACRREDLEQELSILETVPAGKAPSKSVGPGECTRIMTGAQVPEGADCVFMVEESKVNGNEKVRFTGGHTKNNISLLAEDIKAGETVIERGTRIEPQHIAVMASVGWVRPKVHMQPRIGIITTGDEIVEPHVRPGHSQIRNSNGYQLVAQVRKMGAVPDYLGIANDDEGVTREMLSVALDRDNIVILTGGVSMGDFDFVPKVLEDMNVEILFRKLAIQPGKPTIFGVRDRKRIFGLPGNPVSSFNIFELFVKPLVNKMMGMNVPYHTLRLPMGKGFERKKSERMQWLPVRMVEGAAFPLEYHGSAHINSLVKADGFVSVPIGILKLEEGEIVNVRQI